MMVGLRKFSIREFLKKNLHFLTGVFTEIGLALVIVAITFAIAYLLIYLRP